MLMIFKFLGKAVRESCESTHLHPHGEVLALNVASRNVSRIRITDNRGGHRSNAFRRTITSLAFASVVAVQFDKHGIINFRTEGSLNGIQIYSVAVRGQLDTIGETRSQIGDEVVRVASRATTYQPARNQLRISTQCSPCPNVTITKLAAQFFRKVFFLRIAERPNFVTLNFLARKIAKVSVLIFQARSTHFGQEFDNRILCGTRHTDGGPYRIAFDETSNYMRALLGGQRFHTDHYA